MTVFDSPAFDDHERVAFRADPDSGLKCIIALHSTALGPAGGGCRAWHYRDETAAITDVLRLSRGMSYKNAMAGLAMGGGKAVILLPEDRRLTDAMLESFGAFVESLDGAYVTAEDVGLSVGAIETIARQTTFVAGLPARDGVAGGDPSPKTAYGVYCGIRAAVAHRYQQDSLRGLKVAVQGVGNVGYHLCAYLAEAGCELAVADIDENRVARAVREFSAEPLGLDEILGADADILAPCALGAIFDSATIPAIRARIIGGAANNQLATDADGARLKEREILYCPDYVINAGGIINVAREYEGSADDAEVMRQVAEIGPRLTRIFEESAESGRPTNEIADATARRIIRSA